MKCARKRDKDEQRSRRWKKDGNYHIHHPSTAIHHTPFRKRVILIVNDKKSLSRGIDLSVHRDFFVDVKCADKKLNWSEETQLADATRTQQNCLARILPVLVERRRKEKSRKKYKNMRKVRLQSFTMLLALKHRAFIEKKIFSGRGMLAFKYLPTFFSASYRKL